jgi:peptide/nickel transport system permease protein
MTRISAPDRAGRRRTAARRPRARRSFTLIGGCVILGLLVVCAVWPVSWLPHSPTVGDGRRLQPPVFAGGTASFPLGTDALGRDILSIMVAGARYTLIIVVSAALIGLVLGFVMGVLAGYFGGWTQLVLMRLVDIQLAFPALVLLIAVLAAFGPSILNLVLVLGITAAAPYARLVRGVVLSLREREFIEAARAGGASVLRIVLRHLLPNCRTSVIVYVTYDFARLVLLEAALAFLGIGVQPPTPSWGALIAGSREYIYGSPWASLVPGIAIILVVLAFNFVGDEIRDRTDSRDRPIVA